MDIKNFVSKNTDKTSSDKLSEKFKYIKITPQSFIILYIFIISIFSIGSYNFFIVDFIKLETKQNQSNINTILSSINTNIENIKNVTNDYSKWDDSYDFVKTSNQNYIYENFREGTTTLEDLDIDFIIYSDIEGKILFSKYLNSIPFKDSLNFEKIILEKFKNNNSINSIVKYKSFHTYLIKSEIKTSDGKSESNGYIYTGKIINNRNLNLLTNVYRNINLSMQQSNKKDLAFSLSSIKNIKVDVIHLNSTLINNIQIYDENSNYIFSIIAKNKRDIVNNGKKTIMIFNIIISIFLFIILYILYRNQNVLEKIVEVKSKELIKNQKLLAQQSKMAAMGEMIENIAHQWRQPLTVISTASSGVLFHKEYDTLSDDVLLDSMRNINVSTQYLSDTINDFKNFFKKNKKKSQFDLNIAFEKALILINPIMVGKKIKVIQNIQNVKTYGVANELVQVLLNILNNSIDAFEEQKLVGEKLIFIDVVKNDEYIVIHIKDNAGGISESIIDRVFEPYFTTKHKKQGTGIGLYMSFEIINKHMKGELTVKNCSFLLSNKSNVGSQFTIKLPILYS